MSEERKGKFIFIDEDINSAVKLASDIFRNNGVFAYPTDTIYGLGGNPFSREVASRIAGIKERDEKKRFILLVDDLTTLFRYAAVELDKHYDFLHKIWPNPISIILNLNGESARLLGQTTAAFRIPHHKFCKMLLSEIDRPLISTSINKAGREALNERDLISYEFGSELDAIFYTEKKAVTKSSTLIDLTGNSPELLREGAVKFKDIMEVY
ncbi:MAG: threonylcarbamoyl-AMP synthase [Ignavibacteria bacterium]|jgi:L-threonylcarbamoyladenylate synthase|nr:threonylcarbamoyl-AMP synthase [Ignavibacteria bacterium]MCU7503099.1 threonylcarbamoyl-AMP synthase [Ignavibacteria bacterium]MCU7516481.1 threonylcarbamoyl-AMP synthase [Ignavibacteria bacterium]